MTRALTIFEARALSAVGKAAGAGECQRPAGIQTATMHRLKDAGLLALRVDSPGGTRRRPHALCKPRHYWSITAAGRAALASPNPAGALDIPALPDPRIKEEAA